MKNGGDLASIANQATQDFIVNNIRTTDYTWIGAESKSNAWSWADGTPWTGFGNWESSQPVAGKQNAIVIYSDNKWKRWGRSGSIYANFLCQYD